MMFPRQGPSIKVIKTLYAPTLIGCPVVLLVDSLLYVVGDTPLYVNFSVENLQPPIIL